jgi:hypothetical protein
VRVYFDRNDSLTKIFDFKIAVPIQIIKLLAAITDKLFKNFAFITTQS